jgi:hypothetical protein
LLKGEEDDGDLERERVVQQVPQLVQVGDPEDDDEDDGPEETKNMGSRLKTPAASKTPPPMTPQELFKHQLDSKSPMKIFGECINHEKIRALDSQQRIDLIRYLCANYHIEIHSLNQIM